MQVSAVQDIFHGHVSPASWVLQGQSVPHVHIHILPRRPSDFEPMDAVYDQLEKVNIGDDFEASRQRAKKPQAKLKMDSERQPVCFFFHEPARKPCSNADPSICLAIRRGNGEGGEVACFVVRAESYTIASLPRRTIINDDIFRTVCMT